MISAIANHMLLSKCHTWSSCLPEQKCLIARLTHVLLNKTLKLKKKKSEYIVPFFIFLKQKHSTKLLLSRNEGQKEVSFRKKEKESTRNPEKLIFFIIF